MDERIDESVPLECIAVGVGKIIYEGKRIGSRLMDLHEKG